MSTHFQKTEKQKRTKNKTDKHEIIQKQKQHE